LTAFSASICFVVRFNLLPMDVETIQKPDVPPKQSVLAATAGVLGLVSLFLGPFAAAPAVILGHVVLVNPDVLSGKLKGKSLGLFALVTGYITLALYACRRMF
jgi:hypothetical protein